MFPYQISFIQPLTDLNIITEENNFFVAQERKLIGFQDKETSIHYELDMYLIDNKWTPFVVYHSFPFPLTLSSDKSYHCPYCEKKVSIRTHYKRFTIYPLDCEGLTSLRDRLFRQFLFEKHSYRLKLQFEFHLPTN
jgi:hypothetical protein